MSPVSSPVFFNKASALMTVAFGEDAAVAVAVVVVAALGGGGAGVDQGGATAAANDDGNTTLDAGSRIAQTPSGDGGAGQASSSSSAIPVPKVPSLSLGTKVEQADVSDRQGPLALMAPRKQAALGEEKQNLTETG